MEIFELEKLGLNKNESIVYVELMKFGKATAGELIKKTQFHRTIIYDNLDKLIDKGLVSYIFLGGKRKLFQIAPPEMLSDFLAEEQKKLDEKRNLANNLQKEIKKSFQINSGKQEAAIYRGVKGAKFVLYDILNEKKDLISFGAPKESVEIMGSVYWKNYNLKRQKLRIHAKLLFNESLREWAKKEIFHFPTNKIKFMKIFKEAITQTIVCGSKTAVFVWTDKPIVTLIDDVNVSDSYIHFFKMS